MIYESERNKKLRNMKSKVIKVAPRAAASALIALGAGLCIAACGSSSNSSSTSSVAAVTTSSTSSSGTANRAALVACLKSHGVSLPASGRFRPGAGTGTPPSGAAESGGAGRGFFGGGNSKFATAFRDCAKFGGGFGGGRFRVRFAASHAAVTAFVACVKKNGYDLPAPNFSGKGSIFPSGIESNPKFVAASKACRGLLVPSRTSTSSSTTSST